MEPTSLRQCDFFRGIKVAVAPWIWREKVAICDGAHARHTPPVTNAARDTTHGGMVAAWVARAVRALGRIP